MKSCNGFLFLTVILAGLLSFSGYRPCAAAEKGKGVEFYLLEDDSMNYETARNRPLKDLKLQAAPWIAADNIERYDWSSHYVYLKQPVDIPREKGARYVNLHGKPFVVTADGQPCYLGALWSMLSSYIPKGPAAMINAGGQNIERFNIYISGYFQKGETPKEIRDHSAVKEALKRDGQLHEGLQCKLDKVVVDRKDKAFSLVYTYTILNKDQDDLYVLDPKKFHPAIFHDYNNGVVVENVETREYIRWPNPRTGEPEHVVKMELSWYTRLKKGESMTRSVTMKLTPPAPPEPGKYIFHLNLIGYEAVSNNQLLLKDNAVSTDPKAADGRVWLGQLKAEPLLQNVE